MLVVALLLLKIHNNCVVGGFNDTDPIELLV